MNHRTRTILYTLLLSIFILSSRESELRAQSPITVEVKTLTNIDVCGNKLFQIFIQTSEIYANDSIVGYDLFLGYNSEKIQLDQILTSNTISNQLQNAGSEAILTSNKTVQGEIWISGAFLSENRFLKGKQPLIALSGRYLKDCIDTTLISVLQFNPAYYDFRNAPEIITKDLVVIAELAEAGRIVSAYVKEDSLEFKKEDSAVTFSIYLSNDDIVRTKNIECKIEFDRKDILIVRNIELLQPSISIDSIINSDGKTIVHLSRLNNVDKLMPSLKIDLQRLTVDSAVVEAKVELKVKSKCTCINKVVNDSLNIKLFQSPVSVQEYDDNFIKYNPIIVSSISDEAISLHSNEGRIFHVRVYSIIGQNIENIENSHTSIVIPTNNYTPGLYLMEVYVNNKSKVKKMLIKYIK